VAAFVAGWVQSRFLSGSLVPLCQRGARGISATVRLKRLTPKVPRNGRK